MHLFETSQEENIYSGRIFIFCIFSSFQECEGTKLLFPGPSTSKNSQKDRSESSVSPKTSPNSGSPNYELDPSQQNSDYTVEEEVDEKASSVSTVKEELNFSNEGDNLSEHASISTKTSASNVVSEESVLESKFKFLIELCLHKIIFVNFK